MENYQDRDLTNIKDFLGLGDNPVFDRRETGVDELSLRKYIVDHTNFARTKMGNILTTNLLMSI